MSVSIYLNVIKIKVLYIVLHIEIVSFVITYWIIYGWEKKVRETIKKKL